MPSPSVPASGSGIPEVSLPYQDTTLSTDRRVADLLSRLDLEAKAGLLFHPLAMLGGLDDPGMFGMPSMRSMLHKRINHFNIALVPSARELAQWHNKLQEEALGTPLGIPVTISSDPRHSFTDNPATALLAGPFSQWPEPLGFAAIGSTELVGRFADTVRREYLATGIRVALHPQIDLATEPRWSRISGTFGEDADLASRLAPAYVRGLRADALGPESVAAMAKHFPGGGPQKDGEDPHFAYGREQVYPGGRFELHLEPFRAVIDAGVSQMMPYYGLPVGLELEEVGFAFNKAVVTGILREQLGFDGIVCTDWGVLTQMSWGVEHLTFEERMLKALDAGVDQFGGELRPDVLVSLVRNGSVSESRLDVSARRMLREKFHLGLFDHPFVDVERATVLVGSETARVAGLAAQQAAYTLLKNEADSPARLPLRRGLRVYAEGLAPAALADRAAVVATPQEADVAVIRLSAPFEKRGAEGEYESFFHAGSLAFPAEEERRVREICETLPTVLDVYLDRPAIIGGLAAAAAAVTVNFGASEQACAAVLFGDAQPQGNLPFDIPSSMAAVENSRSDTPFDTTDPAFRFGSGLRYA
ncbi:glycoside hydrolase family 3 domain protein [Parafrankia sp. EAN1pec]|uniref:glycoside hydrolase family 3 protein n=1 Tax=Parafrankia sp. (strain EAN1pec) TaxID=298653 RepID=UPI00005423F1|nr:glycoside hydrolase family 3 domain protein [Frankia sp. EAN1pec]